MTRTLQDIREIFGSTNGGQAYNQHQRDRLLGHIKDDITVSSGSRKLWEILLYPQQKDAVSIQNLKIVQQAVEQGLLDVSDKGNNGNTPLHSAISKLADAQEEKNITALKEIVMEMIGQQDALTLRDGRDDTPLHEAIWQLSVAKDEKNITALNDVIKTMIDNDADLTLKNKAGNTPLHYAILQFSRATDKKNITALKEIVIGIMLYKDHKLSTAETNAIKGAENSLKLPKDFISKVEGLKKSITNFKPALLDCTDEKGMDILKQLMESKIEIIKQGPLNQIHNDPYLVWKILNFDFEHEIKKKISDAFSKDYEALPFYTKAWYSIYHFFAESLYHIFVDYPTPEDFIFDIEGLITIVGETQT